MKKLLVVLAALLLVAGFASTAMAAHPIEVAGELDYSIMTNFGTQVTDGFYNFYNQFLVTVDDTNKVVLEIGGVSQGVPIATNYFYLETNLGKAFDLPIGLLAQGGITALWTRKFEVTGHGWERVIRPHADPLGVVAKADFSGSAMFDFGFSVDGAAAILSVPEIGPVSLEAYYTKHSGTGTGAIGANFKATGLLNDMLSVAGMFVYDLDGELGVYAEARTGQTAIGTWTDWAWGFGASVKYDIVKIGASVSGYNEEVLNLLAFDVDAKFTDMVGATGAIALSFAEGSDAFHGADISLYVTPGASTWRLGYSITEHGYTYGSNVALGNGGLYLTNSVDW